MDLKRPKSKLTSEFRVPNRKEFAFFQEKKKILEFTYYWAHHLSFHAELVMRPAARKAASKPSKITRRESASGLGLTGNTNCLPRLLLAGG